MITPKKTVKIYPDKKPWPWVSKSLREKLSAKRRLLFFSGLNGNVFKVSSARKSERQRNSTNKKSSFSFTQATCMIYGRVLKH